MSGIDSLVVGLSDDRFESGFLLFPEQRVGGFRLLFKDGNGVLRMLTIKQRIRRRQRATHIEILIEPQVGQVGAERDRTSQFEYHN